MKRQIVKLASSEEPIFFISDIHSNFPALKAVLASIPAKASVFCAGDILGYYTEPNEVCAFLIDRGVICIKGNHDKYVLEELLYSDSRESKYRIKDTRTALTLASMEWLRSLPDVLDICFGDCASIVRMVHGTERSVEEYIYPDTPITFELDSGVVVLVAGHTHHPMLRQIGPARMLNPGSVGQARDRIPGACYASVNIASGVVDFYRVQYSIQEYQQRLLAAGVQSAMVDMLSRQS